MNWLNRGKPSSILCHLRFENLETREVFNAVNPQSALMAGPVADVSSEPTSVSPDFSHSPSCQCGACQRLVHPSGIEYYAIPPESAAGVAASAAVEPAPAPLIVPTYPLGDTFKLHSLPGATKVIYLDFDGHITKNTMWNSKQSPVILTPAFNFDGTPDTFSTKELDRLQRIWADVAEDFIAFNVDVTTEDPGVEALRKSGVGDTRWGQRVCIGGDVSDWYGSGAGGVAAGSFDWDSDTPCFVFAAQQGFGEKSVVEAISHEVGHTFGLAHQVDATGLAYYGGQGPNTPGWAPILGVSYYQPVSHWSKGEFPGATNHQDQIAMIGDGRHGFGFRPDDAGNMIAASLPLISSGNTVSFNGIIETAADVDVLKFGTQAGKISFRLNPFQGNPNVDILAELLDSSGNVLISDNPTTSSVSSMSANINFTITTPGTYYLRVSGVGAGDPATGGYSDYGSIGQYFVTGYIVGAPTLANLETAGLTYTEGNYSLSLTSLITVADDSKLAGATVRIVGFQGEDRLTFTPVGSIIGTYDPVNGTLKLSGTGTPEQYQAALRSVRYDNTSPNPTGGLRTINFQVTDEFGTSSTVSARSLTVITINDPPTLDLIPDLVLIKDSAPGTINLTGISAGGGESQTLTITATSDNPGFIANPSVTYTSPNTTGTLGYQVTPNASGTATITVRVRDNGGVTNGGVDEIVRKFVIFVNTPKPTNPINVAPTLNVISDLTINEDSTPGTINLAGISAGGGASQTLTITATSDNPGLITDPTVNYASPGTTGTLSYQLVPNASGKATITVGVSDNGGVANGGFDEIVRKFVMTVNPVNDAPVFAGVRDISVPVNAPPYYTVPRFLTGISAGPADESRQFLTFDLTHDKPGLFAINPTISPDGALTFTVASGAQGIATVTVVLYDDGGTANGGVNRSVAKIFKIAVGMNLPPTLDVIPDLTVDEDAASGMINLSGISAGGIDTQKLTITATSDNPGLIVNPTINYISPNSTGTLGYQVMPDATGTATITVTIRDDGGTDNGAVDFLVRKFVINVKPVNDPVSLDVIRDLTINEDAPQGTITLTGIGSGPGVTPNLTITATSDNPGLIANPTVTYTSPGSTGTLSYQAKANASSTATITVTARNDFGTAGGVSVKVRKFVITVNPVDDAPTLDWIPDPYIFEDKGPRTIALAGIGAGGGETQNLTITATSDNPGLIPNPTINYTSPDSTGTLSYQSTPNATGQALITVTVRDDGGTSNGGVDVLVRKFTIFIMSVNDQPTVDLIPDLTLNEDAAPGTINLTGIGAGGGEKQKLTITATSDNLALIPHPTVNYTSPNATGTLDYQVLPNATGTATITLTVRDDGGTANGGVDVQVRKFVINVKSVDDPVTLDVLPDLMINEDASAGTINLTGIGVAQGLTPNLTLTATSDNPGLIADPTVTYTNPNSTGTLRYQAKPNASGTATITVTARNDSGVAGGVAVKVRKFVITVNSVDDPPSLNSITDAYVLEDGGPRTINLAGIGAGGGETQKLTITATSDNPGLIPNPTVNYTSPNSTGTLSYQSTPNASGQALITVTVRDDGGTANGGVDVLVRKFTIYIIAANDPPILDVIPDLTLNEDAAPGTINLTGIGTGGGEKQKLTITATSDNPGLIPNPTVNYTSPNATGTLGYQVAPNASGKATITVTIRDDGGSANGGVDVLVRKFLITVNPANDPPTLDLIPDLTLNEDAVPGTINLTGIGAGGGETQALTITATSDNPGLIPNPTVNYTSPGATGSLGCQVMPNASGKATITVTIRDDGGTANGGVDVLVRTFVITVNPVNDPPTVDLIPDLIVNEDAAPGTINLTGIGAGGGGTQKLTITAASDNPSLIPNPVVNYTSPNATGTLSYQLVPNATGKATITVTVRDDGGTANGGVDVLVRTFVITVNPVNDPPTLDAIADLMLNEDAVPGTINLTGISAGGGETQTLTITATSDNPGLIANPTVNYTSPGATGSLGYHVMPNASGKATITVTIRDDGGTVNGGVDVLVRKFVITVNPVNDPPTLDVIPDLTLNEDATLGMINLSGIGAGRSETQAFTITATSENPGLIANPSVTYISPNATGTLGYQVEPNASGKTTITVTLQDNGGTVNGGVDVLVRKFVITVNPVNDPPTFTGLYDISLPADSPAYSRPGFVTAISAGPADESSQKLTFDVIADKPELFAVQPTISFDGTLSFLTAPGAKNISNVSVALRDDGGTTNGGVDRSVAKTFTIAVGVNRQPLLDNRLTPRINYVAGDSVNPPTTLVSTFGLTGVIDPDSDNVLGAVAVIGVDAIHGQWLYSIDAGASWADLSSASPSAARLLRDTDLLKFVPSGGYLGTAKLMYRAWDQSSGVAGGVVDLTVASALGITSPFSSAVGTADVRVAPVIYSQNEDAVTKGRKLNAWPGVNITDADGPKAKHGVAIVGSGGNVPGHWEYRVGAAWKPLIGMSPTDATLLRSIDSVRFVPQADRFGDAYLLYRAWDQSTGWAGSRMNTADSVGGANAFSVDTDAFFFRVKPVNDRPVLDARAVVMLSPVVPGETNPMGDLVSTILGATATDADICTVPGIAVTARGKIGGTWQYKMATGGDWTNIPNVSTKTALLLGPTDAVRFIPSGSGGSSTLSYKAWDRTTGTAGDRVNSNVGTLFSKAVSKGTVQVTTSPTVTHAAEELNSPTATFSPVSEDTKPVGDSVSFLLGNSFAGNSLTASKAIAGIAVTGKAGTENGSWQYSQNGLVWKTIGDVSVERALLLKDTDKVRFVPNPNYAGPANATLSYRAWDRTRGTAGQLANLALPGNTGGTSPFGVNETIAALNVTPVNDRPVLKTAPAPIFHQVTPGDANPDGDLVSLLLGTALIDADVNSGRGIAISNASTTKGTWQYLLEGVTLWTNLPPLAVGELLLLKETDRIRFVPAPGFVGRVSLAYRAWDASIGNAGEVIRVANSGTSLSLATETATLNVGAKNVRPVLNRTPKFGMPAVTAYDFDPDGKRVSDLLGTSVFDANSGTIPGIAIVGADQKNGLWQYSLNGTDWSPIGIVNPSIAVVLKGDTLIRFVPKARFTGTTTISYKAWDQSDNAVEGTKINARKSTAVSTLTQTKELTVNTAPTLQIV